jgi:hypothetical protein
MAAVAVGADLETTDATSNYFIQTFPGKTAFSASSRCLQNLQRLPNALFKKVFIAK